MIRKGSLLHHTYFVSTFPSNDPEIGDGRDYLRGLFPFHEEGLSNVYKDLHPWLTVDEEYTNDSPSVVSSILSMF